jgi:4-hydroxy-tetrahydrodipicolinate synthase
MPSNRDGQPHRAPGTPDRAPSLRLSGSITALATPFTATGELDLDAWRRLLQAQFDGGTQGVVVAGSTGEAATLYEAEYDTLLRTAVEAVGGRIPVLAGTGLSGTARTVEQTRRAAALGADAALVVTPPYVRPTQAGLAAHFRRVADEGGLPVVLYNVPARTGCDLLPETVAELVAHPGIVALKEARGDDARVSALLPLRDDGFALLSGDDGTAARAMLAGADGVVSVVSNVVPRAMRRLCDLARAGEREAAEALDARLQGLYDFSSVEPNPIPVKALLQQQGIGRGLRLPLQPLAELHHATALRIARDAEAIELSCRDAVAA